MINLCTAICWGKYFGRNLDLEYSYDEKVVIMPRGFFNNPYALIGMAHVKDNYPLFYEATNEKGVSMAALAFAGNAQYFDEDKNRVNIPPFEFIPYILSDCKNICEVKSKLQGINIINKNFSEDMKNTPLHWIIADKYNAVTVESVSEGLKIYENNVGVLTNNPTFDMQLFNLNNYMHLSAYEPVNTFLKGLKPYSRGMGALGLPGDLSSQSRFVRAVFTKTNCVEASDDIGQFFHILSSVEQQKGCVSVGGEYEMTIYSSCCDADSCIYYYKTYNNSQITAVDMFKENINGDKLIVYPLLKKQNILYQN